MTGLFQAQGIPEKRRIPGWVLGVGVSLLVSLTIVLPFYWLGSASGHDFEFHVASWLDVSYQWKEGTIYPRWTAWTNHGFGEPRFIFYPPLSWILGAALTRVVPLPWVPASFVILAQTLAGLCAYFLLRRLAGERGALLGAACYAANPNMLLMTYVRSDFAEQLACAIFPLLVLGALKISNLLKKGDAGRSPILAFALPFAAVWLSNAPAGVIASYSMALLIGWAVLRQRSWQIAWRGTAGMALGLGLTGFYLLPAAYEQRWVKISEALSSGLLPWENFLFTSIADVDHTWFNSIASWCAVCLMLLMGISAILSGKFAAHENFGADRRRVWSALLAVGACASLLMLRFTEPLWMHLPKLRFVQFPWRWMSVVAMIYACFLAAVAERRRGWLAPLLILILSVPLASTLVNNGWWDADEMPTQQAAVTSGMGFDGTDEYDPLGDDHMDLPANAPFVKVLADAGGTAAAKDVQVKVLRWTTENKEIEVHSKEAASLALRVVNYPAWRVSTNGKQIVPERMDDINQMVVPVVEGNSVIQVQFGRTSDRVVGDALSLLSVGICGMVYYFRKRRGLALGRGSAGGPPPKAVPTERDR